MAIFQDNPRKPELSASASPPPLPSFSQCVQISHQKFPKVLHWKFVSLWVNSYNPGARTGFFSGRSAGGPGPSNPSKMS